MENSVQLFLIIGLTKESAHWDDEFIAGLKSEFQTDDIVLVDLPGSGAYLKEKSPISIEKIVEITRPKYHSRLDFSKKRLLVSISLGGMIASEWVKQFPHDFDGLVLMNSSFKNLSPIFKRAQPKAMKEFISIFLTSNPELKEKKIIALCSNKKEKHSVIEKKWVEIAKLRSMSRGNMVRQTLAAMRYWPDFTPSLPVLVMTAKYDPLAHYSCSYEIHQKWQSDYVLIEEKSVGHAIHIDYSREAALEIKNWFQKTILLDS